MSDGELEMDEQEKREHAEYRARQRFLLSLSVVVGILAVIAALLLPAIRVACAP